MATYNEDTKDERGRPLRPVMFNTAKDGSGTWYFALVDTDAHLQADIVGAFPAGTAAIGKVGHDTTSLGDGRKTVTAAGTAEAFGTSTACKWIVATAETDNSQTVVVGGSTAIAALATRRGTPLEAGDSCLILTDNLADAYLDSLVTGEGITFTYGI